MMGHGEEPPIAARRLKHCRLKTGGGTEREGPCLDRRGRRAADVAPTDARRSGVRPCGMDLVLDFAPVMHGMTDPTRRSGVAAQPPGGAAPARPYRETVCHLDGVAGVAEAAQVNGIIPEWGIHLAGV